MISIPSIEKQYEIVELLTKLNKLNEDVTLNIRKEIEARQKQYEYYRNKLLSFK